MLYISAFPADGQAARGVFFAASFAAVIGAGISLLDYTSAGGYVWQHFVRARRLPFSFADLLVHFPGNAKLPAFLFFLIFLLIFFYRGGKAFAADKGKRARISSVLQSPRLLIFIYFAISLCTALASAARVGSNVNYYIENSFSAIIVCGLIYDYFRRAASTKLSLALIVCLIFGGVFQSAQIGRGEYFRWQALDYYREVFQRTGESIAAAGNSDGAPNNLCVSAFPELVMRNGCALEFDDLGEYTVGWSPELREIFNREVTRGRYAAIVCYSNGLQSEFPNYRLVEMRENPPSRFFPFIFTSAPTDRQQRKNAFAVAVIFMSNKTFYAEQNVSSAGHQRIFSRF